MGNRALERAFKVINKMYQEGVLKDYAVGGAIATIYYTEPFATKDIPTFFIPPEKDKMIILTPFSDFLLKKGYLDFREFLNSIGKYILIPPGHPLAGRHPLPSGGRRKVRGKIFLKTLIQFLL